MKRTCFLLAGYCYAFTLQSQHIEFFPLYSATLFDAQVIDVSGPAGAATGTAGVSPGGAAAYSFPVAIPPGTNGAVPSLSLEYSSQSGPGIAGMGWSLSGLSVITRVPQNMYFDGTVKPIRLDTDDRFALDGQRLILKTGVYGGNSSTYGTETENFSEAAIKDMQGGSPKWFEVVDKDGIKAQYGNTADSRFMSEDNASVIFWMLNRITYPDGNYIDYEYSAVDREPRITRILYTGNAGAGLSPYNEISFEYKIRQSGEFSDIRTIYIGGAAVESRFLLDKITVKAEGEMARSYQLSYGNDGINSYLISVREAGSDGTTLNPVIFKYGDAPVVRGEYQNTAIPGGSRLESFLGDFDGDGKPEVLNATVSENKDGFVYFSDFKVYKKGDTGNAFSLLGTTLLGSHYTLVNKLAIPNQHSIVIGDYSGDGIDDVIALNLSYTGSYTKLENVVIYESRNGGTSFNKIIRAVQPNFNRIHPGKKFFYPGDFNGDGIPEYITILGNSAGNYGAFLCTDFTSTGACGEITISGAAGYPVNSWMNAEQIFILDFNGDGKHDIMLVGHNGTEIFTLNGYSAVRIYSGNFPSTGSSIFLGDFNGDGKTDIIQANDDISDVIKGISTGISFLQSNISLSAHLPAYTDPADIEYKNQLVLGDYNGDGKTDIYYDWHRKKTTPIHQGNHVQRFTGHDLFYSNGDGFTYKQLHYSVHSQDEFIDYRLSALPALDTKYTTIDINGDGKTDLISSPHNGSVGVWLFHENGKETLLQKTSNGLGHITEWSYKSLVDGGGFYSKGASELGGPVNIVQPAVSLVHEFKSGNGAGGNFAKRYSYKGAVWHRSGKGFLGLTEVTVTDLSMDTRTISENRLDMAYFSLVPKRISSYMESANWRISETLFTNESAGAGALRFWIKTTGISQNDNILGITTATANSYDNHGNVTGSTVTVQDVHTTRTNTVYQAFPGSIPNKPVSVTVTHTRSGQPAHSITTAYGYDSKGQLTSRTDFSGQPESVTSTYSYDNLGNVISTSVGSPGIATRMTSAGYDRKGRYAESITDEMGYIASVAYDPKWGVPLSATNVQGITTSYEYDPFGRLRKTNFPEGYSQEISYHWGVSANHLLGREVRNETETFDGQWAIRTQTYDVRGNLHTTTEPHKDGEGYITTTNSYDAFNRLSGVNRGALGNTTLSYVALEGNMVVTTNAPSGTTSKTTDATGMLISATDNGGTLAYTYYSHGGLRTVSDGNVNLTTSEYNAYGRQTRLTDLNVGTTEYSYDAIGQLIRQRNAKGEETTLEYNMAGQITRRTGPEGTTAYSYGTSNSGTEKRGLVRAISGFEGNSSSFDYNVLGQLSRLVENIDGNHITSYTYNSAGDISSVTYPSGLVVAYEYNPRGYLDKIKYMPSTGSGTDLYTTMGVNGKGQVTTYRKGNGKASVVDYTYGFPTRYYTDGAQDLRLNWDYRKGNLLSREDARKGKTESFTYDDLNRLTGANVSGGISVAASYTPDGNINAKADAGSYRYHADKIHAVEAVTNPAPSPVPLLSQDITYTAFMQPQTIRENNFTLTYTYGADYNRIRSELRQDGNIVNTRYYFGGGQPVSQFEKDITEGTGRYIQYISGPVGLIAIIESAGGNHHLHYTYTDHLGSILTVTDESGMGEAEQSFDAWGRRRDTASWEPLSPVAATGLPGWIYRGYTGHEHSDQFGLINMNGRMYDPVVGRMLSPDNYVPDPLFSQDYNRYTYARNNPLVYTDPDGEFWHIVIGAALGGGINLGIQAVLGNVSSFSAGLKAFGQGAVMGGMAAIGCASCSVGNLAFGSAVAVGNSYMPSYTIPLGSSGFSISVGVSAGFGSTGLFAGANVGLNYSSEYFSAGFSYGTGYTFADNITGKSGWSQSYGGGAIVGGNDFRAGMFSNQFKGRGLGQRTGTFYFESNGWSAAYENDWMFRVPIADGGDRFRTTGVRIAKGDFSAGLNLFTGDPGLVFDDRIRDGANRGTGFMGTYREEPTSKYRLGAIYGGYKGYRAGWNSEGIRNVFQNNFAHGRGYTHPLFEVLKVKGAPYINYYQTRNRFTTWY